MIRWYEWPAVLPFILISFVFGVVRGLYRLWSRA